ncbi:MAG: hypothetical protein JSW14_00075 [Candidatus Bathyarchaeum sp.]|nr:MAG: hypothetical protein JSW14_00075 [Candidatus Bathyarchaeum sp.]
MSMTEIILRLLENGKWHHLTEIEEKTQLNSHNVKNITNFLAKFNFVKLDHTEQKIKLNRPTMKFLKKIRQIENEKTLTQSAFC